MSDNKEKTAVTENEELEEANVTLEPEDENEPYTTQIKATRKDKRRFDQVAAALGLQKNDAFVALLDMYDGTVDITRRKPELDRFKEYMTSALQMFIDSLRYGESASKLAEDKVRALLTAQEDQIRDLNEKVSELESAADHAKETETKLADAQRQIENLTIQVETFRQINDELHEKAGNVDMFSKMEETIREQEKRIAVLEKEKEMKDEMIEVLKERHPQSGHKDSRKDEKETNHHDT